MKFENKSISSIHPIGYNLYQGRKLKVSCRETNSFMPENERFHAGKQIVSHRENVAVQTFARKQRQNKYKADSQSPYPQYEISSFGFSVRM